MLEIIPAVDILAGRAVRLTGGAYETAKAYYEDAADAARCWADAGAARLHVVDLDGARAGHPVNIRAMEGIRAAFPGAIDISGGIRRMGDVADLFAMGADLVALGTSLLLGEDGTGLASEAAKEFPGRVIASIDLKGGTAMARGWTESSGVKAEELAAYIRSLGMRTVIVTDVLKDGSMTGPSLKSLEHFAKAGLRAILSGGIGSLEDIRAVARAKAAYGGYEAIDGIIAGRALYEGAFTYREAKEAAGC